MNSFFGLALPTPVNIVVAFVIVLVLIGLAAWLIRRIGTGRIDAAARSRQPRLAVIDSAAVDNRRKLVIIRRDNVEHLLMIGGPNDVVVEAAIVRGAASVVRDLQPVRGADTLPRVSPLPDASAWATPPETTLVPPVAPAVAPTVRVERERSRVSAEPRVAGEDSAQWPPIQAELPAEPVTPPRPARSPEPATPRPQRPDLLAGFAAELAKPAPEPSRSVVPAPRPAPVIDAAADKNLADMAQRLEQALRQPPSPAAPSSAKPSAESKRANTKATRGDSNAGAAPKNDLQDFEQEMATLLGRSGKT